MALPGGAPQAVIVTAECDLMTAIMRQRPRTRPLRREPPNERFSFDTFRVRGGKLVEHWDDEEMTAESVQAIRSWSSRYRVDDLLVDYRVASLALSRPQCQAHPTLHVCPAPGGHFCLRAIPAPVAIVLSQFALQQLSRGSVGQLADKNESIRHLPACEAMFQEGPQFGGIDFAAIL
jgi:hypothetical protein